MIEFGAFRLSPAERQLMRDGVPVPLGARSMDILLHLASHPGIVVSKRDLMQAVWGARVVEENNLTVNMAALRKALGGGEAEKLIKTVTGRGYMFVAPDAAVPVQLPPLPPAPRLVGRDAAAAELKQLLGLHRIVSIVGAGGVGKTALALHLGAELRTEFPDGVVFVDLAPVSQPERVPEALSAALAGGGAGSHAGTDRLMALLRDARALLILDNCEHLVDPVAALVNGVVAACPKVKLLITSRESLFLPGEQIFRLSPLPVLDAVRLFVMRARAQGPFELDKANQMTVAAICAQLDGIPLAIEMAVPRLKVLSPPQLAERLGERFKLLSAPSRGATPRHHRTLQAMLDWSYDHLGNDEQALLRSLSVFSGSASLPAIQSLTNEADDIVLLDRLTALADKSMVNVEPGDPPRFRLLETVRQYAARKAQRAGENALAWRHAAYMAERFVEAARCWSTTPGCDWIAAYGPDAENLRSVLGWALGPQGDAALGVRLVADAVTLWWELPETPLAEGQRWLAAATQHLSPDTPDEVLGWIRFGKSWRDVRFADSENAPAALEAVELFRRTGDTAGLGAALWRAGSALLTQATLQAAESRLVEAEQVLRSIPSGKWLALALIRLGDLRFRQGLQAPALARYMEGLSLARAMDFWVGLVNGGSNMTEVLFELGERERALRQLTELRDQLPLRHRTPLMSTLAAHLLSAGDVEGMRQAASEALVQGSAVGLASAVAWSVESTALLAADEGKLEEAARLAGFARSVHPSLATRAGSHRAVAQRLYEQLGTGLQPEALQTALAEGGRWDLSTAAGRARAALSNY